MFRPAPVVFACYVFGLLGGCSETESPEPSGTGEAPTTDPMPMPDLPPPETEVEWDVINYASCVPASRDPNFPPCPDGSECLLAPGAPLPDDPSTRSHLCVPILSDPMGSCPAPTNVDSALIDAGSLTPTLVALYEDADHVGSDVNPPPPAIEGKYGCVLGCSDSGCPMPTRCLVVDFPWQVNGLESLCY